MSRSSTLLIAAAFGLLLSAGSLQPASAAPIDLLDPPSLSINGWRPTLEQLNCQPSGAEGQSTCVGAPGSNLSPASNNNYDLTEWNVALDPDPSVVGFIALQNNLGVEQTFTLLFTVPIVAQTPFVEVFGSINGSVTDANGNTAQVTDAGSPVYEARIDGVAVQTLVPTLNVVTSAGGSSPWGLPGAFEFGPTTLLQPANTDIAIQVKFKLSPGDLASFTSVFNVVAVPEAGTLTLALTGLTGLAVAGRKRMV